METSNATTEDWGKGLTAIQRRRVEKKVLLECTLPALEAGITSFGEVIGVLKISEFIGGVLANDIAGLLRRVSLVRAAVEKL